MPKVQKWFCDGSGWIIESGSGWVVESVDGHYIHISRYNLLAGRSYKQLPEDLRSLTKSSINIKNQINKPSAS